MGCQPPRIKAFPKLYQLILLHRIRSIYAIGSGGVPGEPTLIDQNVLNFMQFLEILAKSNVDLL